MLDNKFKLDNRFKAYLIFSSVITLFWSIMGFGEFGLILWLHFIAITFYVCCNKNLLIKIGKIDPIDIFYLFLIFFSGQILGMFLNITIGDPKYDQLQEMMANNLTFVLIVTFITAPLAEEVIFRGIIYSTLKKTLPVSLSRCLQAILFSLFHGTLTHLCPTFIFALYQAYIFDKYEDLKASIISHICFNICSFLIPSLMRIPLNNVSVIVSSAAFVIFSLYLLFNKYNNMEFFDDLSILETLR